ncbi:hypothetical protein PINS_up013933 [Pythium insidiosum]|nr:hypothetical protein PINS_up013933 [Pythium insidiosum]
MKLYAHLDRLERRLRHRGLTNDGAQLDPEALGAMDCLHFFGDEPIRAIQQLISDAATRHDKPPDPADNVRVLDLGTGYGGTARLLAHRTQCHVDALELQPDLSMIAEEMTRRCGLSAYVTHMTGDFLQSPVADEKYDIVVGLLSFLHIGQWRELFTRCYQGLKPGGVLYVEDFFRRGVSFSNEELQILRDDISCRTELLSHGELVTLLQDDVGFEIVRFEDVTDKWAPFVSARATAFASNMQEHAIVDGGDAAKALLHFYKQVATVFAHKNLGGAGPSRSIGSTLRCVLMLSRTYMTAMSSSICSGDGCSSTTLDDAGEFHTFTSPLTSVNALSISSEFFGWFNGTM